MKYSLRHSQSISKKTLFVQFLQSFCCLFIEFMRRAAQLGMNAAGGNMAAAFAAAAQVQANSSSGHSNNSTTPPLTAQQLLDGQGGGGSPLAAEALRRPRSVYSSQQVAQLEAYFRYLSL